MAFRRRRTIMTTNQTLGFKPVLDQQTMGAAIGVGQEWMRKAAAAQAEWLELCQGQAKRAMDGAQALSRCKDVGESLSVQTDLARSMIEAYAAGTQRIAAIWTEAAAEATTAAEQMVKTEFRQAAE